MIRTMNRRKMKMWELHLNNNSNHNINYKSKPWDYFFVCYNQNFACWKQICTTKDNKTNAGCLKWISQDLSISWSPDRVHYVLVNGNFLALKSLSYEIVIEKQNWHICWHITCQSPSLRSGQNEVIILCSHSWHDLYCVN